jgi:hypothetical protein
MVNNNSGVKTYTLSTGETVTSKDGTWPTQYSNRTQAYKRVEQLQAQGFTSAAVIHRGRPFYVRLVESA